MVYGILGFKILKTTKPKYWYCEIHGQSVVTSGIYERHLQINGKDYHHIFDKIQAIQ